MHRSNYSHLVFISRELRNSSCVWCNHDANTRNVNDLGNLETIDSNDSRQIDQELPRPNIKYGMKIARRQSLFAALHQV